MTTHLCYPSLMRFARRMLAASLLTFCGLLCSPSLHHVQAQAVGSAEQSARDAFEAGRIAYDHGRFAEALGHFELAYELNRHPKLLFNVARAAELEGRFARAIDAYEGYLRAIPDADNRDFVQARVRKLRDGRRSDVPVVASPAPSAPPSPREAAALAVELDHSQASATAPRDDRSERKLYKSGWFWGAVGVVAAGAATTAFLLTRDRGEAGPETDLSIRALGAR